MYKLYAFASPNSLKAVIGLEELELEYELIGVNIRKGEQKSADYLALNPNGKVPVLVDDQYAEGDDALAESAAILVYLAERHGKLLPTIGMARARVFEQLFFHASGIAPAFGQSGFFQKNASERLPLAIDRFQSEANRTAAILDQVLARRRYVAGDDYTIADIAHFGWMWRREFANVTFEEIPNVARWYEAMTARPAVQRAIKRVEALMPPQA
ncbi:glutathione S-transferase family protein [Paraburkholderia sp. BCC1885]|uniref:glutathione S-transferase family protein n=1 Tax=Paraburkholderia sp. BCC1885 TaxID=2562669 RepID=UPI001183EF4B|nr:glutathione S-transferase N-terminal domain-containing protein [Paraburkholderia sp. BCC1885]